MNSDSASLVSKVWNYAHVLRDQGIGYGDYLEQITFLLFLKMDQERQDQLGESSFIPAKWRWEKLAPLFGDALELRCHSREGGNPVLTLPAKSEELDARLRGHDENVHALKRKMR